MFFGRMFPQIPFWSKIGKIPTSYRVAMSYEEQLLWLCKHVEDLDEEFKLALQQIIKELNAYVDNLLKTIEIRTDLNGYLDDGYYVRTGKGIGEEVSLEYIPAQDSECAILSIAHNQRVQITGKGGYQNRLWCIVDDQNRILEVADGDVVAEDLILDIPENAHKIIVNFEQLQTYPPHLYRLDYSPMSTYDSRITECEEDIDDLQLSVGGLNHSFELLDIKVAQNENDIDTLEHKVDFLEDGEVYYNPDLIEDKYIRSGVNVGDVVDLTQISAEDSKCIVFSCLEGDKINISGKGGSQNRLWAFLDSTNHLLQVASDGELHTTTYVVTAPLNTAKCVCNFEELETYPPLIYKTFGRGGASGVSVNKLTGDVILNSDGTITEGGVLTSLDTGFYLCNFGIYNESLSNLEFLNEIVYYDSLPQAIYGDNKTLTYDSLNSEWSLDDKLETIKRDIDYNRGSIQDNTLAIAKNTSAIKKIYTNIASQIVTGGYIEDNVNVGSVVDVTQITSDVDYAYALVDCQEGDVFLLSGQGKNNALLWCFLDSSNQVISKSSTDLIYLNQVISAPLNTAKALFNFKTTNINPELYKLVLASSGGSALNIITAGTFDILSADDGLYALPAGCTITFGDNSGTPVTYTTIAQVVMSLVTYSNITYSELVDISSGEASLITGTSNHTTLVGAVSSSLLTNTINYIRVNGNFVTITSGIADLTIPEFSYGTTSLTPRYFKPSFRKCLFPI